jgi:hypothetical protein
MPFEPLGGSSFEPNTEQKSSSFEPIPEQKQKASSFEPIQEQPNSKLKGAHSLFPALTEANVKKTFGDRGLAVADSVSQGLAGVTPKYPELQAKYPVQSFATQVAAGTVPFMMAGVKPLLWAGIGASHEIIHQATDPNEQGNALQRSGKVGTSAVTSGIMGHIFKNADLLKNIVQRAGAVAAGGGATSAADSIAKDVIDGKAPDIHNALVNAGVSAATMGLLKGIIEVPQLRRAIVEEGSRFAGKPVDFKTAKEILTSVDVDLESLSPTLKAALERAKKESVIKGVKITLNNDGAGGFAITEKPSKAKDLFADKAKKMGLNPNALIQGESAPLGQRAELFGVSKKFLLDFLNEKNDGTRLQNLDNQIYDKMSRAFGTKAVPEWRMGQVVDFGRMSQPRAAEIQNLLNLRNQVARGADPSAVMFRMEVARKLKVKEYIEQVLKEDTRNVKTMLKEEIQNTENPTVVTPEKTVKGTIDTVGAKGKESTRSAPVVGNEMAYVPYLKSAIASLQQQGLVNPTLTYEKMDVIKRNQLLKDVETQVLGGREVDVPEMLAAKLAPRNDNDIYSEKNLINEVSVVPSHQGKEDAPEANIYDWRSDEILPIKEFALRLKLENKERAKAGLPLITVDDHVVVHRQAMENQQGKGNEKLVKQAIAREYARVRADSFTPIVKKADSFTPVSVDEAIDKAVSNASIDTNNSAQPNGQSDLGSGPPAQLQVPGIEQVTAERGADLVQPNATNLPQSAQTIPELKAEKLHEVVRKGKAKKVREVVKDYQTATALLELAESMDLTGSPQERMEQLSKASGLSVGQINAILKPSVKADFEHEVAELDLRSDVEDQLFDIAGKLDDWYLSINDLPLDQIIEDANTQKSAKIRDARRFDRETQKETGSVGFFKNKSQIRKADSENIASLKKGLIEHRDVLGKMYLDEIRQAMEKFDSKTVGIAEKILKDLKISSPKERVLYASKQIKDAIRESQAVISNKKRMELDKAKVRQKKDEVDAEEASNEDWEEYAIDQPDAPPKIDGEFEVQREPFDIDTGGLGSNLGNVKIRKRKLIMRLTEAERHAPIPFVIKIIDANPWLADLTSKFTTTQTKKAEVIKRRQYFKVTDPAHSALFDYVKYEDSVKAIIRQDLQPILDYVLENVQAQMLALDPKSKVKFGDWVIRDKTKEKQQYQPILDLYAKLMKRASSDVIVKEYDPRTMSFSRLGNGPHESPEEVESYVRSAKFFYQQFKIPVADQVPEGPMDILDANGNPTGFSSVPGTLRNARQAYAWKLLTHPSVMQNNSLQKAILFYKAQLEWPALSAQIKLGIYSNTDILKKVLEGYAKNSWEYDIGQQVRKAGAKGRATAQPQRPKAEHRTPDLHAEAGEKEGWTPVDDFFNDAFDYLEEALKGQKQVQLAQQLKKVPLPRVEYTDVQYERLSLKDAQDPNSPFADHNKIKPMYVMHSTDPWIIEEAQRMSKLLGKPVDAKDVLNEGGWVQGKEDDGLNKWYRGSFEPPFIYKTLYEEIRTLLRPAPDFETLGRIARAVQTVKFITLSWAPDSVAQYVGAISVDRPAVKIIPYQAMLIPRSIGHLAKGVFSTGPKIASGTHSPTSRLNTEYEIGWTRKFLENGMTAAGGYRSFMANLMDKVDPGKFPQRQDIKKDWQDYIWSVFGTGEEIMGQMIEGDILRAAIAIAEQEVYKGRSVDEAAKYVAQYMNHITWNLHRTSWQGDLGVHLRNLTTSRNMAIKPFRTMMIAARILDQKTRLLNKTGAISFKTAGTGGKEGWNTIAATDMYERFMPSMGWRILAMFCKLYAISLLTKFTLQYMLTGDNPLDNPPGAQLMIKLPIQDTQGQQLYLDFGLDKEQKNIMDILSTVIDPIAHQFPGWEDVHTGRGVIAFIKSKLGIIQTLGELLPTNTETYDHTEGISWENAKRAAHKMTDLVPINPWIGSGKIKIDLAENPLMDNLMKSASLFGVSIRPVDSKDMQEMKTKVRHEKFVDEEIRDSIYDDKTNKKAVDDGKISVDQFINNKIKFATKSSEAKYMLDNWNNIFKSRD